MGAPPLPHYSSFFFIYSRYLWAAFLSVHMHLLSSSLHQYTSSVSLYLLFSLSVVTALHLL